MGHDTWLMDKMGKSRSLIFSGRDEFPTGSSNKTLTNKHSNLLKECTNLLQ